MLKVNGKAYDWGDVDLKIPGLNIQVQEISYDDELEIEEVYGSGSKPRGYGTGNYKASGKLSMLRDDYDDLLAYKSYLSNERGKSPARDDADATAAMNKVTAMPY